MNKNDFAKRPPLGWNSYDYYDTAVTEEQVKANADYMAANLKEYGWEYVVVDIQWYAENAATRRSEFQYIPFDKLTMDEYGRLQPAVNRFPSAKNGSGFKPLADYVHSLGLKFGIHIMRGIPRIAAHQHMPIKDCDTTANEIALPWPVCEWNPDMYGVNPRKKGAQEYYDSLMELYASWGVDYIKVDDICNTKGTNQYAAEGEIELIHKAIIKCGRPIVLSLSPGPALIEKSWHLSRYANMWRITDDFWDNWDLLKNMFDRCELWQAHVKEGCWPDCDMLPLGKIGKVFGYERDTNFTKDEQLTMMNLWGIFRSPLMLGAEMTLMDDWTVSLLTNKDLLRANQYGKNPTQIFKDKTKAAWVSVDEEDGAVNLAIFNLSDSINKITVTSEEFNICKIKDIKDFQHIEDIWSGNNISETVKAADYKINVELSPHASVFYRLT